MADAVQVVVLIPVRGTGPDVVRAISTLCDSGTPFDVLVVDDGSTPPVVMPDEVQGHRVVLHRLEVNVGCHAAVIAGLERALEEGYAFVVRQDVGDRSRGRRVDKQVEYLRAHPRCAAVGCWLHFVTPDGGSLFRFTPPSDPVALRRQLHIESCLAGGGTAFRAAHLRAISPLGPHGRRAAEDYALSWALAAEHDLGVVPEILIDYQIDPDGVSAQRRWEQLRSRLTLMIEHFEVSEPAAWLGVGITLVVATLPLRARTRIAATRWGWTERRRARAH